MSRLITQLKGMQRGKYYTLAAETCKDIRWWYLFLPQFKGTGILWMLEVEEINSELATDACLIGAGGVRHDQFYCVKFPQSVLMMEPTPSIAHLELWAIIVAVKLWVGGRDLWQNSQNKNRQRSSVKDHQHGPIQGSCTSMTIKRVGVVIIQITM